MEKTFQVHIFGKAGCDKCALLNKRLEQLLLQDQWQAFEKVYHDVETVEGLVAFSQTECMNPSSIPGFIISRQNPTSKKFHYLPRVLEITPGNSQNKTFLYSHHGLQTDYSGAGNGVIPPVLIKQVLEQALLANPD